MPRFGNPAQIPDIGDLRPLLAMSVGTPWIALVYGMSSSAAALLLSTRNEKNRGRMIYSLGNRNHFHELAQFIVVPWLMPPNS